MRQVFGGFVAVAVWLMGSHFVLAEETKTEDVVKEVTDVAYYDGKDAHPRKHKLDLYVPKDKKDCPVLFFVHGGAWRRGDKSQLGVYRALGRAFASQGILTVVPNYRLSPSVKHPTHAEDVARAFAWVYKNVARYGGRNDRIFLSGHSAGGHLVALLATDPKYLKKYDLTTKVIQGVAPISGVFIIPERILSSVFPLDLEIRKLASPIAHAREELPPFLIFFADNDLPHCGKAEAEAFTKALRKKDNAVETREQKNSNHILILASAALPGEPVFEAICDFIRKNLR